MRGLFWFIALALIAGVPSFAADKSDGCGVGWYVAKENSLISTSTRGTINAFLPPTFSMSSGTSNCAQHSIVGNDAKDVDFVRENYDQLQLASARGEGEYLESFAMTLGCSAEVAAFGSFMKSHYGEIFVGEQSPEELVQKVKLKMKQSSFADSCRSA